MELPRKGREYLRLTLAGVPSDATVAVSFDEGGAWHDCTKVGSEYRLLVCGPDAEDTTDAVVVSVNCMPVVRVTDTTEVVLRHTGNVLWLRPAA